MSARRVAILFRSQLRAGGDGLPVAHAITHGALTALVCALLRAEVPPYAYALVALCLSSALVALPLLGELGALLRADPSRDWLGAQPIHPRELRAARALAALALVVGLALCSLAPAAALAPAEIGLAGRALLVLAGLGCVSVVAAALLAAQALLGARGDALLVALQAALVVAITAGLVFGLRKLHLLRDATTSAALDPLLARALPPAWFADFFSAEGASAERAWLACAASAIALAAVALAPRPERPEPSAGDGPIGLLLRPARALAARLWVARGERGPFDLVYDALPREREFRLRTYPLLGIPAAFLWIGASGARAAEREGLLALLLFVPGMYLPALLAQVPCSTSSDARWLLGTAPVAERDVARGAQKAIAVRFLLPIALLLCALAWQRAGGWFALRVGLPAALVALVALRLTWPIFVREPPLSRPPEEMEGGADFASPFIVLALALTVVAVAVWRLATTPAAVALVAGLLAAVLALQAALDRFDRPARATTGT